jgi:putative IMPACT (imprinted ancient) family translation regulator
VVVVRYFGGTLLGVPGLINAYRSAASMVLQVTPIIQKPVEVNYRLQFDYTVVNEIMTLIKQCNCTVISQEMQLFCSISIGISKSRLDEVLFRLKDIKGVEIQKIT